MRSLRSYVYEAAARLAEIDLNEALVPAARDGGASEIRDLLDARGGDRAMPDGTVFAGKSPDTGKAMYTTPADAPLTYTFNEAARYAGQLNAQKYLGHDDWHVPTRGELNVLFRNRAVIGGFNEIGSLPAGWYWSSSPYDFLDAWAQRFSDGSQYNSHRNDDSSLRCVR